MLFAESHVRSSSVHGNGTPQLRSRDDSTVDQFLQLVHRGRFFKISEDYISLLVVVLKQREEQGEDTLMALHAGAADSLGRP
jgi:hypothetical protein